MIGGVRTREGSRLHIGDPPRLRQRRKGGIRKRAVERVATTSGLIGLWPQGALPIHDDSNTPNPGQQNYKMVDWREIKRALAID